MFRLLSFNKRFEISSSYFFLTDRINSAAKSKSLSWASLSEEQKDILLWDRIIVSEALKVIEQDGRYFHFRRASEFECAKAAIQAQREFSKRNILRKVVSNGRLRPLKDSSNRLLEFHFFETYGYRFTVLLNFRAGTGILYGMERVTKNQKGVAQIKAALLQILE